MTKKELQQKYLDELLQVRQWIQEGNYDAADRYTEKDILVMKEDLLNRIVADLLSPR